MNNSWLILADEFSKDYIIDLGNSLHKERESGKEIYPREEDVFAAFRYTPLEEVKVVIVGQDPYHQPNQAHGLSFSVHSGVQVPPSLTNIFKEITSDMCDPSVPCGDPNRNFTSKNGCLIPWAQQGVFLLNRVLTVEDGRPGSHHGRGWEEFTDRIIDEINKSREHVVFMLWGSHAQKKWIIAIDRRRHLVLSAPHPSPLSADRGFFGCRHFSRANRYLVSHGKSPINWFDVD